MASANAAWPGSTPSTPSQLDSADAIIRLPSSRSGGIVGQRSWAASELAVEGRSAQRTSAIGRLVAAVDRTPRSGPGRAPGRGGPRTPGAAIRPAWEARSGARGEEPGAGWIVGAIGGLPKSGTLPIPPVASVQAAVCSMPSRAWARIRLASGPAPSRRHERGARVRPFRQSAWSSTRRVPPSTARTHWQGGRVPHGREELRDDRGDRPRPGGLALSRACLCGRGGLDVGLLDHEGGVDLGRRELAITGAEEAHPAITVVTRAVLGHGAFVEHG
jgi:hypothetical protein